jgi:acetyl esterase/lipase
LLTLAASAASHTAAHAGDGDLFSERAAHPTVLAKHGPSPQPYDQWPADGPLSVVEYPSMGRKLRGLLALPTQKKLSVHGKAPVLVYLHGGFALGESDVADCLPFIRAGFAVWAPAWRGENGNPGDHELAFGELDDARAAIAFVHQIPEADPARVVVFGHSAGGMLSSLLALSPDLPVKDTGSAGGLYGANLFDHLARPFVDSPSERRMRLFAPYARQLKQPHFACVGDEDGMSRPVVEAVAKVEAQAHLPLVASVVKGDHFASLAPCMEQYLARVLPKVQ